MLINIYYIWIIVEYSKISFQNTNIFWIFFWFSKYLYFITNIHCKYLYEYLSEYSYKYLHEYSHDIKPDYKSNAPSMDKDFRRKVETTSLEWWGWGLRFWEPLHVLCREGKHVSWNWLVGSARATTAAALHFCGRCRGGAPQATRAAPLVNTFFIYT